MRHEYKEAAELLDWEMSTFGCRLARAQYQNDGENWYRRYVRDGGAPITIWLSRWVVNNLENPLGLKDYIYLTCNRAIENASEGVCGEPSD